MSHELSIKRGDLLPPFIVDLTNGTDPDTGEPIPADLTTITSVKVIAWRGNVLLFNRTVANPTGADALNGVVTMPWQVGDTSVVADLYMEVEVMWPGSKPQTFPPGEGDYIVCHVTPDLG